MAAPTPSRLQLLGVVFLCVVIAVVAYTHQLIIPLFLGLFAWGKSFLKSLTPKLTMLFIKNGVVIQIRRTLVQASTHVLVKSHRPWRRWLTTTRLIITARVKRIFETYLNLPLWMRTAIALGLLLATAGSSFAVFALLIIPQPVLVWLRQRLISTLNKLGISQFFTALWKFVVPKVFRDKWHIYVKWTVGRRQVRMAKSVHKHVARKSPVESEENVY